jgi:hypothetical protein
VCNGMVRGKVQRKSGLLPTKTLPHTYSHEAANVWSICAQRWAEEKYIRVCYHKKAPMEIEEGGGLWTCEWPMENTQAPLHSNGTTDRNKHASHLPR